MLSSHAPRVTAGRTKGVYDVKKQVLACLVTLAAAGSAWGQSQLDTVKVTGGAVQGVPNGNVVSFKGIPFAAPPTGENRWRAPQPVRNWQGVRHAEGA